MSQGLSTAVSGIRANQSKIDVISDNIANMNTVGFKSSLVNFENVFVRTMSSGTAPGSNIGGTNPLQIGLGTTVGEISRNFNGGTVQSTGRSTDLNVQGLGFFTLQDSEGSLVLTRAGNFSLDSEGYLVNPKGLKAVGSVQMSSTSGSSTPIRIPQALFLDTTTAPITSTDLLTNFDSTTISAGTITLDDGTTTATITISPNETIQDVLTDIDNSGISGIATAIDPATGALTITADNSLTIGAIGDTSNFLDVTGLSNAAEVGAGPFTYTSSALNANSVLIRPADSSNNTFALTAFSVGKDGSIEATYANGDKITVAGEPTRELLYRTSTGREIESSGITVMGNAVRAYELQMQMANVINTKGLVAQAGNIFTIGPNAGYATFSYGKSGGIGSIESGGLETSNVDLPSEFSDMILAQRGIDANSRTFNTQNQIMSVIVNLGRG